MHDLGLAQDVRKPGGSIDVTGGEARPRFLYLIGQLSVGGAERQLLYLLQALQRDRYRPAVVVWNYHPQDAYVPQLLALNIPVYPLATRDSPLSKLLALRRLLLDLRPEVVHSYSFFTNVGGHLASLGAGTVAIGSIRGDYLEDVRSVGLLRAGANARWPRFQILNSASALNNSRNALGLFRPRRAFVVRNALDLDRFRCRLQGVGQQPELILGVGSLLPLKRWDRLVKAAAELKRRGVAFRVEIAGEGPTRSALEALARTLDVSDRVRLCGRVDGIERRLHAATLLAHTSDSEGCPNAVMEAMAAGLPVVATDSGDVPRLVEHGVTGFLVQRGDDDSLVECLGTLLQDGKLRNEMGSAARLKAEREFGLQRLVSETLDVYRAAGWRDSPK